MCHLVFLLKFHICDLHFISSGLAIAPFAALTLYANVFIGPAKIAPIPDGYEPLDEEYSYHPITR